MTTTPMVARNGKDLATNMYRNGCAPRLVSRAHLIGVNGAARSGAVGLGSGCLHRDPQSILMGYETFGFETEPWEMGSNPSLDVR